MASKWQHSRLFDFADDGCHLAEWMCLTLFVGCRFWHQFHLRKHVGNQKWRGLADHNERLNFKPQNILPESCWTSWLGCFFPGVDLGNKAGWLIAQISWTIWLTGWWFSSHLASEKNGKNRNQTKQPRDQTPHLQPGALSMGAIWNNIPEFSWMTRKTTGYNPCTMAQYSEALFVSARAACSQRLGDTALFSKGPLRHLCDQKNSKETSSLHLNNFGNMMAAKVGISIWKTWHKVRITSVLRGWTRAEWYLLGCSPYRLGRWAFKFPNLFFDVREIVSFQPCNFRFLRIPKAFWCL